MKIFKYQLWHFLILLVLLTSIYFYINQDSSLLKGKLLGISSIKWFLLAIISPIAHQIYVLLCWRLELFYNSISKAFGIYGFKLFKIGFAILFVSRLLTIILLAISTANTLNLRYIFAYILAVILSIPSTYLIYSVKKHFGMDRAFGIDHFHPEKLKKESFVKKGIFKHTSNGMYIYGFFIYGFQDLFFCQKRH